ncbi:MAG: GNAT family N-acetyltransferase [Promethearchaeota archaeon]
MELELRQVKEKDIPNIMLLMKELVGELDQKFEEERFLIFIKKILRDPVQSAGFFTVEDKDNDKLVGMVSAQVMLSNNLDPIGYIKVLIVTKKYRNRNIGMKLMTSAIDYFREKKVKKIITHIRDSQIKALNLYKSLGFTRHGSKMILIPSKMK